MTVEKFEYITNSAQIEYTKINSSRDTTSSDNDGFDDEDDDEEDKHAENENVADFLVDIPTPIEVDQDQEISAVTNKGQLLRLYYRLCYISYNKMRILMNLRVLPRRLLKTNPPLCACCDLRRNNLGD